MFDANPFELSPGNARVGNIREGIERGFLVLQFRLLPCGNRLTFLCGEGATFINRTSEIGCNTPYIGAASGDLRKWRARLPEKSGETHLRKEIGDGHPHLGIASADLLFR